MPIVHAVFSISSFADYSPVLGARIVAFLPEIMLVVLERLNHIDGRPYITIAYEQTPLTTFR